MNRYFTYFLPNSILALVFLIISNSLFAQTTIVSWDFNDSNTTADGGIPANQSKQLATEGRTPILFGTAGVGATSINAYINSWSAGSGTKYWIVEVNTAGYDNITLSSKQRSSAFGPRDFKIQYRIGAGGTWTDFTGNSVPALADNWTNGVVTNLVLPTDADNQSSLFLRWIMVSNTSVLGGTVSGAGNSNIDDIVITGLVSAGSPTVDITSSSPASGTLMRGGDNYELYRLDFTVTDANANFTDLTLTTAGTYSISDIKTGGFKLWYSPDASFDSGSDTQLDAINAVASGGSLIFSGFTQTINDGTTGYIFLSIDVSDIAFKDKTIIISPTPLADIIFTASANKAGTDPVPGSNTQTFTCLDFDSEAVDTGTQPGGSTISSLNNDLLSATNVIEFYLADFGSCDGLSTFVTNIRMQPGASNTADWTDHIGGLELRLKGGSAVVIDPPIITDSYIDIPIQSGNLEVLNGEFPIYEIGIYLNANNLLVDGAILSFNIPYQNHGFQADPVGSGFNVEFTSSLDIESEDFTVEVIASELQFDQQPVAAGINKAMATPVVVGGYDIHGNFDAGFSSQVEIASTGSLVGSPLQQNAVNGQATFTGITHDAIGSNLQLTATSTGLTSAISNNFDIIALNEDFTTCPPAGWNSVLISGNSWVCGLGYASVNGIGGAAGGTEAWYIAPSVDFSTLSNAVLTFDTWTDGQDLTHPTLEVLYSDQYSGSGNPNLVSWTSLSYNTPAAGSQTWTPSGTIDLSALTTNTYIAFKYTSTGNVFGAAAEWRIDNVAITENGCLAPTAQASNLTFSNVASTSMTLNWNSGNGIGRIVLSKVGSAVDQAPVDGTVYTVGDIIGTDNNVVYVGNGSSADITGLVGNTDYHFAVYEYNCGGTSTIYNVISPAIGNQSTTDPDASDIIVQGSYLYEIDIAYSAYQALNTSMNLTNSVGVMGLTLRDGGENRVNDGLITSLNSISFSTNGSSAVRAAAIYYNNTFIGATNVNGSTEFTLDLSTNPIEAQDSPNPQKETDFELRVTFERGDNIIDNEQIVFTVTEAIAGPGTGFADPDAGGAQSIQLPDGSGNENVLRVISNADDLGVLNILQGPIFSVPVNEAFSLEVEAVDSIGTRDLDKSLTVSSIAGVGNLVSSSSLTKNTLSGTALWTDLNYDTEESTEFEVTDGGSPALTVSTGPLQAKPRFTTFTFTGIDVSDTEYPPDFQPANLNLGNLTMGGGLSRSSAEDAFNASGWSISTITDITQSYYEIQLSSAPGYAFSLNSVELDERRSSTGPRDIELRTSLDNFANTIASFTVPNNEDWRYNQVLVPDITIENEVNLTIRIYASGAGQSNGTWRIDNLEIFGNIVDVSTPEFTSGYPQSDSTALDGFDLIVNLNEAATAYYVVQPEGGLVPSIAEVKAGQAAGGGTPAASGSIDVTSADTEFFERVGGGGLNPDSGYDVFYVLSDGTNDSAVISQTGLRTSDTNTILVATAQPAGPPYVIPSTATTVDDLIDVFNFQISDQGTADGAPTYVTQLVFNAGLNNTVTDWATVIGGLILYNVTEDSYVAISNISIIGTSIIVNINPGDLSIANGGSEVIALSIHLTNTVTDKQVLEFAIGGDPHTNTTYNIGSQFSPVQTLLTSNAYTIEVTADRLNITYYTPDPNGPSSDIELFVEATDANLNIDVDEISQIEAVLGQGIGSLSVKGGGPVPVLQLVDGAANWPDIRYDTNDDIITIIVNSLAPIPLLSDTTGTIIIGTPADLIVPVNTDYFLSSDLDVNNVIINDGGTLTISNGVRLGVSGNYTFNGTGTLVDQGATTAFIGGANATQTISKVPAGTPEQFYNIEIDQANNANGVFNEMSIELINTLTMTSGDFDIDGAANDQNFTLVSTVSNTARIGPMVAGTSILGEVTWQRSLRNGPAGFRYIGTPIKGQTLASISDDVWIQGIAERYPGAWTNISTYYEPIGTEGQAGFEGWVDFTSNGDALNIGEGMKLYLWSIDYATEQVIQMKGAPFIGDGGDGVAGSGESVTLNTSWTSTAYDGGGWNFFANPYPSEIDWDQIVKDVNINGEAVHIWNPNTQSYGSYSPLSGGISINGVTRYIASGQGFFVKAEAGGSFIQLSESSKATVDGNSFLRVGDETLTKMKIEISSQDGKTDETAVTFTDLASDNYDMQYDVRKLAGGYVNLSSVIDEKQIAINAMGEKRGVQSVRLNIDPYVYGSFTMKFPQREAFEDGATIRLVDKYLDKTKYINSESTYVFNIDENNPETYGPDRFEIQFVEPAKFRFNMANAKAGQEFIMPVFADKLEDILATNMAVRWDTEALTFIGIEETGMGDISNFDLTMVENGKLVYSDERIDPLSLPDGTQLFSIRFKAKNGIPQAQLRFEQALMSLKAINDIDMPFSSEDVLIDILQNKFVNGAVATYSGQLVNGVRITAQNSDEIIEKISDLDGSYTLNTYEQSNYNVSAFKSDDVPLMDAVTTLDIIKARSHILGKEAFTSPYQWIAADVNGSQSITAIDLVEMRKVILGINPTFQSGLDWLIIPDTYDLTNNPFSYQTSVDVTMTDQDVDLNFVGVKVGDVDNSWSNSGALRRSNLDFALNMENIHLQDDLVEIPIVVSNYSDIRGYQFTVSWDPTELQYYGASSEILEGFFNDQLTNQGVLTTLWDDVQGKATELKGGEILITLQFRALHENAVSEVAINSAVTPAVAFDGSLNAMTINASPVVVNLEELRNGSLELLQNVPNPFDFGTEIGFKIPKAGLVRFSIVNTLGEMIYLHEDNYKAGIYNISWDRSQGLRTVSPGVYLYRLESNGEEVVKKMVIK